ncbi:transcriptional regulator [Actinomadura sp. 6N118]|uniref:transcriptional regulator n=1 Tax=Actinomadura sp. 6N118 TaxID=3375151 RepID=UPI0037AC6AAF
MAQLRTAAEAATKQRLTSQYSRLAETAPPLLAELTRATHTGPAAMRREAAELLTAVYRAADAVAYKYGYYDLSARLIELMRWAARRAENPVLAATTAYVRTEVFFASSNLEAGLRALEDALANLVVPESTAGQASFGALHMRAAVVAARLSEDPQVIEEHFREARRLTERVPEGIYNGTAFGPASLRIHEVSVAVELGDATGAIEAAGNWAPPDTLPAERRSHFFIDLHRAQLWLGLRDDAFESLQVARRIAPQHVREHSYVRDGLVTLLRLHKAPSHALIRYAEWARAI